jgi:hypothetical protein
MKSRTILLLAPLFCATHVFAQIVRAKPLSEKTVTPVANSQNLRVVEEQKKPAPPPPPPTNIQSVLIDIQNGDDGKEGHTYVTYDFEDNSKRAAASFTDAPKPTAPQGGIAGIVGSGLGPSDEYIAGTSISLPIPTQMCIPTGQTMKVGNLTVPALRYATVADFSNGGELKITLNSTSNGHNDIWKIQTITARISFENDPHSPHIVRWSNIVLSSQGSPVRELFFDNNYKPL